VTRARHILTLDIGSSRLAMAEFAATPGQGPQLLNYGISRLDVDPTGGADSSAYVVAAIRELMRTHGFRPAPLFMSISGQMVFPRYVKLPHVTRDKLMQMIRYEAEQNVPFPIDEVVWDYQLVEGGSEEETHAMLVAVKTENVVRLTDCVEAAGLEPEVIDVAPMALYNSVRYNYPDIEGCTMVLDMGARSSNLIFIEGRRVFSRSIPVAGMTVTQELMKEFDVSFAEAQSLKMEHAFVAFGGVYAGPESEVTDRVSKIVRGVITRLHAEVNRSINFYRSQQEGSAPQFVLLTGGSSVIPHMDTFFREKLKVAVEHLNPFASVTVSPAIGGDAVSRDMHMLGEVTGLALRGSLECPMEVNLLPPAIVQRKTMRRRQPFFAIAAAAVMLMLLFWGVVAKRQAEMYRVLNSEVSARLAAVRRQDDTLKQASQQRKQAMQDVDSLFKLIRARTYWSELLTDVHGCLLEGMWLTNIKGVSLDGIRVSQIEISGRGFLDMAAETERKYKSDTGSERSSTEILNERLQSLKRFAKIDIVRQFDDFATRVFTIKMDLKEPVRLR
jgi:type IV pilus assembly protein PilM